MKAIVSSRDVTGVVTAGGQSRRFGRDKATTLLAGVPMAEHVARSLRRVVGRVVLITNYPERHRGLGIATQRDRVPHRGPLGAVDTALHIAMTPWCLVVGCDYPLVSTGVLATILEAAGRTGADAVVPMIDGRPQPLLAAYRQSCRSVVARRVVDGRLKMVELFSVLHVDWLTVSDLHPAGGVRWSFLNINTPEDLERAERFLRSRDRAMVSTD